LFLFSLPVNSWPASVLKCTLVPPPLDAITLRCWYPSLLALTLPRRRHALPHVFRFNGCWSSFRSLLFAFRRFRSFPRSPRSWFPRTGHPLTLSTLILSMRAPPTWPLCGILLAGISLSVVSLQSLSRTALNVSLLRYIAFVFRLVYLVPSHGGHGHVYQKASRAKVEEDIFALISSILTHLDPPPSDIPTPPLSIPPIPPTAPPTDCHPQGCGLLIYIAVCQQLLRS